MPPELKDRLILHQNGLVIYRAGISDNDGGGYPRNFTRDSIESAIQFNDPVMLRDQLAFGASIQATHRDPITGAEPGKYHHESPGVLIRGLSTEYNACDATAWALIGYGQYENLTGDRSFIQEHEGNIIRAVEGYTLPHLNSEHLFIESPAFADANRFALRVTYWKDSVMPQRIDGEPIYPVVYPLVHAQNMAGLRSAARVLGRDEWISQAEDMSKSLASLFNPSLGVFEVAIDKLGPVSAVSSDSLSMLFFLEPEDLTPEQIAAIIKASLVLETPAGYRGLSHEAALGIEDRYHIDPVWPVEQARIHQGANKFKRWTKEQHLTGLTTLLEHVEEVSARVRAYLNGSNPELLIMKDNQVERGGCDPQLWSISANEYFQRIRLQENASLTAVW